MNIIKWLTGMDIQTRALEEHVEYDRMFYVAFYLEKECAAVPLSGVISIIKDGRLSEDQVRHLWKVAVDAYDTYVAETGRVFKPGFEIFLAHSLNCPIEIQIHIPVL